jgi:thiol-disulfide isomerase/thioredoxin
MRADEIQADSFAVGRPLSLGARPSENPPGEGDRRFDPRGADRGSADRVRGISRTDDFVPSLLVSVPMTKPRDHRYSVSRAVIFLVVLGSAALGIEAAEESKSAAPPSPTVTADGEAPRQAVPVDPRKELSELFSKARLAARDGRFAESNEAYAAYLALYLAGDSGTERPAASHPIDAQRSRIHMSIAENYVRLEDPSRAVEELKKAVDAGLWQSARIEGDPSFRSLVAREDFTELVHYARSAPARMAFGLRDLAGKTIDAANHKGKVLIIDVWGTWCPPCRQEIPHFIELYAKYRAHGLEIFGLTHEKQEPSPSVERQVQAFARSKGINYRCAVIGRDLIDAVPIERYPTTYFIDHEGNVAEKYIGLQSLFTLETRAVQLLNKKILAEAEAAKKAKAAKQDRAAETTAPTEPTTGSSVPTAPTPSERPAESAPPAKRGPEAPERDER